MTRQKLVEAMGRIMATQDPAAITIAEITEEADVGFGSFYNHFSSKEDILDTIYGACRADFVASARATISDKSDVPGNIACLARLVLSRALTNPLWARCMTKELTAGDAGGNSDFVNLFKTQLSLGKQLGQIHIANEEVVLRAVFACLFSAVQDTVFQRQEQASECEYIELSLRMLGMPLVQAKALANSPLPHHSNQPQL
mgnify:CR=1 FL=1